MYIDAHNHIDFYGEKIKQALNIIKKDEILTLACSQDEKSYLYAKEIALQTPLIVPCFGIHPWTAHENHRDLDRYERYIEETSMIGEIGLDFHWVPEKEKYPHQVKVLKYFFQKAKTYDKITNLHTKGAEEEILSLIKKYSLRTPLIHWYSGPFHVLKELLDYGCYFTVSVDIGYSETTRKIVEYLPMNRMLTETDGPTALQWVNGEYGYPNYVIAVLEKISGIKKLPIEESKMAICDNFNSLLKIESRCSREKYQS